MAIQKQRKVTVRIQQQPTEVERLHALTTIRSLFATIKKTRTRPLSRTSQRPKHTLSLTERAARSARRKWGLALAAKGALFAAAALAVVLGSGAWLAQPSDKLTLAGAVLPQSATAAIAPRIAPKPLVIASVPKFPREEKLTVGKGDTLLELLTDTGVSMNEAHEAVAAIRTIYDPRRINSGQAFNVTLKASSESPDVPSLSTLKMPVSSMATIELHKIENGKFVVKKVEVPVTAHTEHHALSIKGSLYQTAQRAGLSPQMIMELMKGFSYDVDFQRDIQRGHTLEVVVDTLKRDDGRVVGAKNMRYAKLKMGRKNVEIYRYADAKGQVGFYNAKGQSLKKTLLRTPVDGARISSGYGLRKHPVLGYNKMHKGMDFAASTGTPIYAAGDGVVEFAGRHGGYGNYVRVKHNGTYSTAYAHAHRFAKGIRKGTRVRQGQIIAYVGTTGRSTGPHLHYEVLKYGQQTNPAKIQQFNTGTQLAGNDLKRFKTMMREVDSVIAGRETGSEPKKMAAKSAKKSGA